jgi:predicted secreted protein
MRQFNEQADATEVAVTVGEVFQVCLAENPTAGFRWRLDSAGEPTCLLVHNYFSAPGNVPGGQGIHHWNFKAVASGSSTIRLTYARHWQNSSPARRFQLEIRAGG